MTNTTTSKRSKNEIKHFTTLEHIWWGAQTVAGKKRYLNKAQLFKSMCIGKKPVRILEIGAGDGEFTKNILDIKGEIVATDVTPAVVERGRKSIKAKNLKFKVEDAEKLSFKEGTFDIVCGISILHHIVTEKALEEAYRVLKKGGRLFFTEPNLLNPHIFIGLHTPGLREKMEYSPDETALIRWRIAKILKKIGFKTVKVKNYDFLHPSTPAPLIPVLEKLSNTLEKMPIVKEVSGSLIVFAVK